MASHIEFIWAIYQLPNHTFFPGGFLWMPQPAQPTLGSSLAVTSVNARQELVNKHHRSHALEWDTSEVYILHLKLLAHS